MKGLSDRFRDTKVLKQMANFLFNTCAELQIYIEQETKELSPSLGKAEWNFPQPPATQKTNTYKGQET